MKEVDKIFRCTRCGYCCQGETTVSLDNNDQINMCSALDLDHEDVRKKYWRVSGNVVQMKIVEGHCIFYQDGCTVHQGRPWRCGEWPLHPSILDDRNNFETISESCPGINKDMTYEDFCEILENILFKTKRVKC